MKHPEKLGLMATRGDTPILNKLRKSFEPQKPKTLEERLAELSEVERDWLLSNATMLQTIMHMRTKVGDFSQDYLGLYNHMYPRDMNFKRQDLLRDFLNEVAPLDWEPQPYVKPDYTATLDDWVNPYDVNRIEKEAREKYAPEPESKEHSDFLNKLIQSESSGRANAEITIADGRRHVGKLMFSQARLEDYMAKTDTSFTQDEFKADELLQDKVAEWHVQDLQDAVTELGDAANGYDKQALVAVAHLGGVGGMRRFVQSNGEYNPQDELGTSLSDYYQKFSS